MSRLSEIVLFVDYLQKWTYKINTQGTIVYIFSNPKIETIVGDMEVSYSLLNEGNNVFAERGILGILNGFLKTHDMQGERSECV